jgi:GTP-binding protein
VKMFSALKKQGVDEVAQLLWQWSHPPVKADVADKSEVAADPAASATPPEDTPEDTPT